MFNEAKEYYVYAIAGGETLQIIDYLEKQAETAKQELKDYAAASGISVAAIKSYNDITFALPHGAPPPAGWTITRNRAGDFLEPDYTTEEGMKVSSAVSRITAKMNIAEQFDQLCHSLAPSSHLNNRRYSYETIGDKVVLACPKQSEGDAIIPPGSKPISYLDYVTMQEKANPTPPARTRTFQKTFKPS